MVDGTALADVFDFEVGGDAAVGYAGFGLVEGDFGKAGFGGDDVADPSEIFLVVGLDGDAAGGDEGVGGGADEIGLEEAAFVVAFFGPRVGVVNVENPEGFGGQMVDDQVAGVGAHEADVGHAPADHAVGGVAVVFVGPFDAEEVAVGILAGPGEQEAALTGADLHFDGG